MNALFSADQAVVQYTGRFLAAEAFVALRRPSDRGDAGTGA